LMCIPVASMVFPALNSTNFRVLGLTLRSFIHFELILVQGINKSNFSFLQADNHFPRQHLLKRLSFLHSMFLALLSKIKWIHMRVLYSVSLVFMSAFMSVPFCFYCYCFVI
jgi:hypothetical protein